MNKNPDAKLGILLVSLPKSLVEKMYKEMSEEELQKCSLAVANTRNVADDVKNKVLEEFLLICQASKLAIAGGLQKAKELLTKAVGAEKAEEIITKLSDALVIRPFDFLKEFSVTQIYNLLNTSHAQVSSCVLAYLQPNLAAEVVQCFDERLQAEIVTRIATIQSIDSKVIKELESLLKEKANDFNKAKLEVVNGLESAVKILTTFSQSEAKKIIETISLADTELSETLAMRLFTFVDLIKIPKQYLTKVLFKVESRDLALALKRSDDMVKEIVFSAISKNKKEMLIEDLELMGPVRVKDIEEAENRIIQVARQLEETREISLEKVNANDII